MQVFGILLRRELALYFASVTGYAIIATVLLLLGLSFADILRKLNVEPTDAPITEFFFATVYFWLILLLTTPIITMRLFALEKFAGTYETLMTTPVRDTQIVLAKFCAALLFFLVAWLPLLGYLLIVRQFSNGPIQLDPLILSSTLLGLILLGAVYVALGCFASSLTRSQVVAAILSYALGLGLFLLSMRAVMGTPLSGAAGAFFRFISMSDHMQDFARGVVDTRPLILYLSLTALFLFLTVKVVESRRWK